MQIPALGMIKLSFIFFYRRLFCSGASNRMFDLSTRCVGVIVVLWTVALWFALFFACGTNFSAWWISIETVTTQCVKTLKLQNGFAISDTITDVFVFVLPIHQVG